MSTARPGTEAKLTFVGSHTVATPGSGLRLVEEKDPDHAAAMLEAFPEVDPGLVPYGYLVLCQVRSAQAVTKGGVIVPPDSRQTQQDNMQVAKVIALGPMAFRSRDRADRPAGGGLPPLWPEGAWAKPGDFVRVRKYGGDRWKVPVPGTKLEAEFVIFNDLDLIGRFTGDPLAIKAYI